jgi:hypothetical protein
MTESIDVVERERLRLRLNERFHGAAAGPPDTWPQHRRQAVGYTLFTGGLARLRQRDVAGGIGKIEQAFVVWPGIVERDECWFELACAYQPRGIRGTGQSLDLSEAAELIRSFEPLPGGRGSRGRAAFALAWMALAVDDRLSARRYARDALHAPGLRRKGAALTLIVRSFLPGSLSRGLASWRHDQAIGSKRDSRPRGDRCGSPSSS